MDVRIKKVPPKIGYYLAGFTDGEGSFSVSFRPRKDYPVPWKISLSFNVSQKDRVILTLFRRHLGCGTLRGRADGVWYYETTNLTALTENVIPFFERFPFLSAKKNRDFGKFKQIVALVREGEHLRADGIRKILQIREGMNDGGKRRHSHADILATLTESSETIRRAPLSSGDDIVRSPSRGGGLEEAAHEDVRNANERS